MKKKQIFYLFLGFLAFAASAQTNNKAKTKLGSTYVDPIRYVDPFIGVDGGGNVFPGAALPFSLVNVSPDVVNPSSPSGYNSDKPVVGISHNHMSGCGIKRGHGNILIFPQTGSLRLNPSELVKDEVASPGYYGATFAESGIRAEVTLSACSGVHQYTFPKADASRILIDLSATIQGSSSYCTNAQAKFVSDDRIEGQASFESKGGSSAYTAYFVIAFNQKVGSTGAWKDSVFQANTKAVEGSKCGLIAGFNLIHGGVVGMQVGVSYLNLDKAKENLGQTQGKSFATVRHEAEATWRTFLSKIKVAGGSETDLKRFYTGLYRCVVVPNDVTGNVAGWDVKTPQFWNMYCIWDTYITSSPLFTLIAPDKQAGMVNALAAIYKKHGWLPDSWYGGDFTHIQGGTNADNVIGDAFIKGLKGINREDAYAAIRNDATQPGPDGRLKGRYPEYFTLGYIPFDPEKYSENGIFNRGAFITKNSNNPSSRTLEYSRNDYSVACAASILGKKEDAERFKKQSMNGWTLWNPETKFFWGKNSKGEFVKGYFGPGDKWVDGFDPRYRPHTWTPPFYEGSAWGYAFCMQHDTKGLIERHGGKQKFMEFLDLYFDEQTPQNKNRGNHDAGNEPSFLTPWLYTFVGRPDRNVDRVRNIITTKFNTTRKGLPGNDDGGAMSSQVVFASMGFFPVSGQDYYLMASPFFSKIAMQLADGKTLVINANNLTEENKYIQSATLNGKKWDKGWFQHKDIINGAVMVLEMGPKPSDWGTKAPMPKAFLDK